MQYLLGALAFLFFICTDIGDLHFSRKTYKFLFPLGVLVLIGTSVWLCVVADKPFPFTLFFVAIFSLFAITFFVLLCYTLFFAIPAVPTYLDNSVKERTACDTGVYALCRHPGVLWLFFCLLFLGLAVKAPLVIGFSLYITVLNTFYVAIQDRHIFPALFKNYSSYQETTPFLFPTVRSTRRCFETLHTQKGAPSDEI